MLFIWVVASFIFLVFTYPLLIWLVSLLFPKQKRDIPAKNYSFACIITAYKDMTLSNLCIESLMNQEYDNFKIFLVADDAQNTPPAEIPDKLAVLIPSSPLGSKVRSLHYALQEIKNQFDYVVIFDPDNLADKNCLKNMDAQLSQGYDAVQGKRRAKNLDTRIEQLDASGEFFYNYFHRAINFKMGASAFLFGSGMAFKTQLFNDFLEFEPIKENFHNVILDEDKILQYYLSTRNITVAYAADALIYDEKVGTSEQLQRQRTRWIIAFFNSLKRTFRELFIGLVTFNKNRFMYGLQASYPPLFMNVLFAGVFCIAVVFVDIKPVLLVVFGLFIFIATFLLFIKLSGGPSKMLKSFLFIPVFIFTQVLSVLNMRKKKNDFAVTHNTKAVSIKDLE